MNDLTEVSRRLAVGGWFITYDITNRVRTINPKVHKGNTYYSEVFVSDDVNGQGEPILITSKNNGWTPIND